MGRKFSLNMQEISLKLLQLDEEKRRERERDRDGRERRQSEWKEKELRAAKQTLSFDRSHFYAHQSERQRGHNDGSQSR